MIHAKTSELNLSPLTALEFENGAFVRSAAMVGFGCLDSCCRYWVPNTS
ncbi:uncharacterized protein METZ01_LOCUS2225 [marine metagenome]|uniref:Uncharacterized protein n=1 Tax=marine metagenome TaxID=408172 RepID=A0A381N451_9ZZZZ